MKKTGIITLNGENNYGNRLQNYALQVAVSKLDSFAETVVFRSRKANALNFVKKIFSHLPIRHRRIDYWRMLDRKSRVFKPFSHQFIKSSVVSSTSKQLLAEEYDLFITGSDQVWNPNYIKGDDTNFLSFAPRGKRISYAASFGVSEVPKEQQEFYRKNLEGMRSISVREEAGVEIVRGLTGKDAELVPDPTILLDKEDWGRLTEKYNYLKNERYLVVYALHSLDVSAKSQIESYASENDLEIYQIMGDFYHPEHKTPDPAEFVARIKYAQAVFTDSFHACVFSIIMHTPFKVFDRKDMKMSSRIETLLKTYQMQSATSDRQIDAKSYDFEKSDKIAAQERARGMSYLTKLISAEKAT